MFVLRFDGERMRAIALDLVAQGPDHLRVAGIAALAHVDVASGELERRVDAHVGRGLHCPIDGEERRDLHQSANAGHNRSEEHTSELQSLMRTSYAVFCLQNKTSTYTLT